jgi:uncharacterized protein (TIGR02757 family)
MFGARQEILNDARLNDIKELLDYKYDLYNRATFIEGDPISIPHQFNRKEDIEIAGFLTANISWGQRKTILLSANRLLKMMEYSPYDFIVNSSEDDLKPFRTFRHRTFNGTDCVFFIRSLKNIYFDHGGLENGFRSPSGEIKSSIINFRNIFFSIPVPGRTLKHIADPAAGASAKRINMFLRWMVRKDNRGVDFGIWDSVKPSQLYCPLDLHTGNVARKLGLITRKQNDWKSLEELMAYLKAFDPADPVKYDFALFGLGIFENF